jgi:hypothetical protein
VSRTILLMLTAALSAFSAPVLATGAAAADLAGH